MEAETGLQADALIAISLEEQRGTSFFEWVSKIDRLIQRQTELGYRGIVRYTPNPGFGFPSADVERIEVNSFEGNTLFSVVVNFMGLYGSTSPLPAFYSERILQEVGDKSAIKDFLDIFNHQAITLLIQSWKKYRWYLIDPRHAIKREYQWIAQLLGVPSLQWFGENGLDWTKIAPFLGLLRHPSRPVRGLEVVIQHYFELSCVEIEQCVEHKLAISSDQWPQLGMANSTLAEDLVCGETVMDRMSLLRIWCRALTTDQLRDFVPDGKGHSVLTKLVKFYLQDAMLTELCLVTADPSPPDASMTDLSCARMGWNYCVGEHDDMHPWHVSIPLKLQ